jgi:hypothetical protein
MARQFGTDRRAAPCGGMKKQNSRVKARAPSPTYLPKRVILNERAYIVARLDDREKSNGERRYLRKRLERLNVQLSNTNASLDTEVFAATVRDLRGSPSQRNQEPPNQGDREPPKSRNFCSPHSPRHARRKQWSATSTNASRTNAKNWDEIAQFGSIGRAPCDRRGRC